MFQEELKKPQQKPTQTVSTEEPFKWNKFQANYDQKKQMKEHS